MAKEILKLSTHRGAFVAKGDIVEFEIPYGVKLMTVSAVEIDLTSGEAVIHGKSANGNKWIVPANNVRGVENRNLTVA